MGLCGSENPTRASFPFIEALGAKEAGYEAEINLGGDAVVLMRDVVAENVHPVGWPPLKELLQKVINYKISIYV